MTRDDRRAHAEGGQGAPGQGRAGHVLIESVQLPEVRPRPDVGEGGRDRHRRPAARSCSTPRSCAIRHRDGARVRGRRGRRRAGAHVTRARTSSRRCRSARSIRAMDPPAPPEVLRRGRRAHVPRLHDRRARRAAGVLVPRQLDLHPRPGGEGRADPELRLVVAVPGEGGAHLPRPRVLRERGRRHVDQVRRGPRRAGQARARSSSASPTRARSRPATSCGCRRRIPVYDEHYKDNVDDRCATGSPSTRPNVYADRAATACTSTTTRTTRCARRCSRSRTSSAPHHDVWSVNVEERVPRGPRRRRGRRQHQRRTGTGRDAPVLPRAAIDAAADRRRGEGAVMRVQVCTPDLHRGGEHRGVPPAGAGRAARRRHPRPRRQQPRRHRRHRRAGRRPSSARSRCCAGPRSAGSATRTAPASRSGSPAATRSSARSTPTSRTTPRCCRS